MEFTYPSAQELFSAFGVLFPVGASAGITVDGDVVVRNTEGNLAVADVIVASLIDSRHGKLSLEQLKALRSIIADTQANGQIRPATIVGFGAE